MLQLNCSTTLYSLKGNTPLLLQDQQLVWTIQSGSLALFATLTDAQGHFKGNRRYLFTAQAGEILFGISPTPTSNPAEFRSILAVALEETELKAIAATDFADRGTVTETDALEAGSLVDQWILHWGEWLSQQTLKEVAIAGDIVQASASPYLSVLSQQTLQIQRHAVRWVQIQAGISCWMGLENLHLDSTSPVFPLTADTWLKSETPVEVYLRSITDLENGWLDGLNRFHHFLHHYLDLLEQVERESIFRRFQDRERLNEQITTSAMNELVAMLKPRNLFFQEGAPLLVAAGAVGHALGIPIRPPAASEDVSRLKDPLDAIARASKFRTRRVMLVGKWWTKEHGPLLTYTEEGQPVALLPEQNHRYVLFDPVELTRTLVDEDLADTLAAEAYMFYRPLPSTVSRITDILRFAIRGHILDVVLIVGMGILGTLLGMVVPQATSILINDAIPNGDRAIVWQLGLALFAAACGKTAFEMTRGLLSIRVENAADVSLQPAVWDKLLQLHPAFFRSYSTGDLLMRLLSVSQIRAELSGSTQRTLLNAVFALLNLGLMFIYSWKLAIVGVGITVIIATITSISSFLLVRKTRQQEELDGKINGLNVELINGVAKLRVAAAEDRAFGAWAKLFSQRVRLMAGIQRIDNSITVLTEAVPLLSSVLIFWFSMVFLEAAQTEGQSGLTIGAFLAFNSAFGTFLGGVNDLSNTITNVLDIVPLWERAEPILKGQPETDLSKADPGRLTGHIHLDHVVFRYREDGPLILDAVDVMAAPGEFIAIVGPSGSGKSTLFRVLLGFEVPAAGTVYYDGQDLAGLDVQAVRRQLGVVLQNGRIGSGSIFDNIAGGALVSLDQVWDAAQMAGFADDIRQMPMGMHTVISEGGLNLSGGQRQRLLIARAIVLKPKIILLDEATSALDNRTQAIVADSLNNLNATRIAIAHRLSTIRNADRIYVMEAGRVVQVGRFDELVNQEGLFARLAARQLD
jgi:NHLM bacteriocin system ABC transporter ATP-binding protein